MTKKSLELRILLKTVEITSSCLPSEQIVNPNNSMGVKRGRGRPPGTRNKATLIAQAKLLAQQQAKAKAASFESNQQSPLGPARGVGGLTASSTHRVMPKTQLYLNLHNVRSG